MAGHSVTLLQERGETFRERLVDGHCTRPGAIARVPAAMASGPGCHDVRTGPTYAARAGSYPLNLVRFAGCRSTPEHEVPTSVQNVYETLRDK